VTLRARLGVAGIAWLAAVFYVLVGLGSFRGFTLGMDLGIFDQAVKAYSHFQTPYIQIKAQGGFNILGDHFSPVLVLLAPFYRLWPDARLLMCAQAVAFAAAVWFVGHYACRRGLGRAAYLVEAGFALSYGVLSATVFDFHEVAFGLPIVLWACWAFLEKRDAQLIVACGLMCVVKEDMPMYAAGLGLALFFTGRRLFGVVLAAAAAAVTLLLVFVVIPHFSYWGHYAYIGGGARGLRGFGAALAAFGSHLVSWQGLTFLLLIAATAGVGVVRPLMWVVLPTVLFRFMANDTVYLGFRYQYGVLLTAVAFMALIDGWAALRAHPDRFTRPVLAVQVALLVLGAVSGLLGSQAFGRVMMLGGLHDVLAQKAAVENRIPDGANVAADVFLVPQIVDRTTVQVAFPTWTDETGAVIRADYVFLDTDTISYQNRATNWVETLIARLTGPDGGYRVVDRQGRFVLLMRSGA